MKIKEVAETLEQFAPLPLQESYDNAGLQIGLTGCEDVSGVLLCLDVTEEVICEAQRLGCNLIISHHPLLFRPLRHITTFTQVERCVIMAIKYDIAIYSAHTNLDNAEGGVNFMMAEQLHLQNVHFLEPLKGQNGGSGIVGRLEHPMPQADFLKYVAEKFQVESLLHNKCSKKLVHTVAMCGGAGEFLLNKAIEEQADAFLTGEMGYHRYFGHEDELLIAVLGHYQSEQYTIQLLHRMLQKAFPTLHIEETTVNTNPIRYNNI